MTRTKALSYKDISFEDFDPNGPDSFGGLWMVYEGWHSIRFYAQRGHALNRCHQASRFKLYEQESGRWELRAAARPVSENHPKHCDFCGKTLTSSAWRGNGGWMGDNEGVYRFRRTMTNKVETPLVLEFLCKGCK